MGRAAPESKTVNEPNSAEPPRIAVAIPCYNEAAAIDTVIAGWRSALPEAEIVVFDNNSSDGTGAIARDLGVRVIFVPDQGKGHAVRAIFRELADHRAVVLVDGDGTYPPEAIRPLLEPILDGSADMTVGARRPVAESGAMSPVRGLGNVLIRAAFRVLIGRGPGDLLSGYRVFSRHVLQSLSLRSSGFEIETELASEAVARKLRVIEAPVPYHPRIAGTVSKLKAYRDGQRILATIVAQSLRYRPWRPLGLITLALIVAFALAGYQTAAIAAAATGVLAIAFATLLTIRTRKKR
jgi:glycosyltransferase involved in cell wall biosynthesis